jgi:hypothetical protein
MTPLYFFALGSVSTAAFAVGAFFFRFWRRTRDRFFLLFAIAFWLMGSTWAAIAFIPHDEGSYAIYVVRLLAYLSIIVAIVEKNRAAAAAPSQP